MGLAVTASSESMGNRDRKRLKTIGLQQARQGDDPRCHDHPRSQFHLYEGAARVGRRPKNKKRQRDPEMHSVAKGNQWFFGMRCHIGVDAASGLVHSVVSTAAVRVQGLAAAARGCTRIVRSLLSDQLAVLRVPEFRMPAAAMASTHRGYGRSRPAPGMTRHHGPVV